MEKTEEWRKISGFDAYEISNLGRVRSWTRRGSRRLGEKETQVICAAPTLLRIDWKKGYGRVTLRRECVSNQRPVHRLVCEAFHGPARDGQTLVRHLDDNQTNNRSENLAWGSSADNRADSAKNGRAGHYLSDEDVRQIRECQLAGVSAKETAEAFDCTRAHVCNIWRGANRKT